MKIRLEIYKKLKGRKTGFPVIREYDIEEKKESIAKNKAELKYLNEYINQETFIKEFTELNIAKYMVDLVIKAFRV